MAKIVIGGLRYNRVGRCEAPYHTMAGSVSVAHSLYRQAGTRGGQPEAKVVDPVSLRAGAWLGMVGDGWLPHTARVMSHEVQKGTSREAEATALEYGLHERDEAGVAVRIGLPVGLGEPAPDDAAELTQAVALMEVGERPLMQCPVRR